MTVFSKNMAREDKKNIWLVISLFILFFLLLEPLGAFSDWIPFSAQTGAYSITKMDPADDTFWYSYLRSMFFDMDIDFGNEEGYRIKDITSTGYTPNYVYCMGNAILWFPYFFIAHILTKIFNLLGYPIPMDGYSYPYLSFTAIGSAVNGLLGGIALYFILARRFNRTASLLTVLLILFGSHLPFYLFVRSRLSHANDFFAITSFILFTDYILDSKIHKYLKPVFLGIMGGLLTVVRMNNAPVIFYYLYRMLENEASLRLKPGKFDFQGIAISLIVFTISLMTLFSLPFIGANIIYGSPWTLYESTNNTGAAFNSFFGQMSEIFSHFSLWELFFRHDFGLVYSAPILAAGIMALPFYAKKKPHDGMAFLSAFFPIFLMNIMMSKYDQSGVEYGLRYLIAGYPMVAVGVCFIFDELIRRLKTAKPYYALAFLLLSWQYAQIIQYKIFFNFDNPESTWLAFSNIFTRLWLFPHYLLRSTSWMAIFFLFDPKLKSFTDFFFLILIPLAIFLLSICSYLLFQFLRSEFFRLFLEKRVMALAWLSLLLAALPSILIFAWNPKLSQTEVESRSVSKVQRFIAVGDKE